MYIGPSLKDGLIMGLYRAYIRLIVVLYMIQDHY